MLLARLTFRLLLSPALPPSRPPAGCQLLGHELGLVRSLRGTAQRCDALLALLLEMLCKEFTAWALTRPVYSNGCLRAEQNAPSSSTFVKAAGSSDSSPRKGTPLFQLLDFFLLCLTL